jgi:hypothetical protein
MKGDFHKLCQFWTINVLRSSRTKSSKVSRKGFYPTICRKWQHCQIRQIPTYQNYFGHLPKMPELAKLVNTDLSKGFRISHGNFSISSGIDS